MYYNCALQLGTTASCLFIFKLLETGLGSKVPKKQIDFDIDFISRFVCGLVCFKFHFLCELDKLSNIAFSDTIISIFSIYLFIKVREDVIY